MKISVLLASLVAGAGLTMAGPVVITDPSTLGVNDSVVWSQLGASEDTIPNPFTATSTLGLTITGTFSTGTGTVNQEDGGWAGILPPATISPGHTAATAAPGR